MKTRKIEIFWSVGTVDKREVSPLNHELFRAAKEIFERDYERKNAVHMGWMNVADFIGWLEENYIIKKRGNNG